MKRRWVRKMKRLFKWSRDFAERQYDLFAAGVRDERLHDFTLIDLTLIEDGMADEVFTE
jgi:hypothetical protein